MVPEMVLSAKAFPTDITRVWSFIRVCSLMDQEIVRLGKVSTTVTADKLLLGSAKIIIIFQNYSS